MAENAVQAILLLKMTKMTRSNIVQYYLEQQRNHKLLSNFEAKLKGMQRLQR